MSARRTDSPALASFKRLTGANLQAVRPGDRPRKTPSPELWKGLAAMQNLAAGYEASRGPLAPVFTLQKLRRMRSRRLKAEREQMAS